MSANTRAVLRADAVWDLMLGLALLAAGLEGAYDAVGLPEPGSPGVVQACSLPLFAFSALLWRAAANERLAVSVSRAAALANLAAVALAAALPIVANGFEASGVAIILVAGAVCGLFAVLEARIVARQSRGPATV
jgi:hypothetical protein